MQRDTTSPVQTCLQSLRMSRDMASLIEREVDSTFEVGAGSANMAGHSPRDFYESHVSLLVNLLISGLRLWTLIDYDVKFVLKPRGC